MIKNMYVKLLLWFLQTKFWNFIVIKVLWRFRFSNYYAQSNGYQFDKARRVFQRGDILFSKDKHKVVSYLIPGKVSHAALYLSETEIIEATHLGVRYTTLFDFFKESDLIIASKCSEFDTDYVEKVILEARGLVGKPYDSSLSLGTEALYCSELIYQADIEKRIQYDLTDLIGLGRPYISPEGILSAKNIEVIFTTEES